eukprot:jgi/Botrbrau1/6509/Bobra.0034s0082.1
MEGRSKRPKTITSQDGTPPKRPRSSIYRGVTLFAPTQKWRAQISFGGETTSLGDYATEEEAARAYDKARIHFKKMDNLNFGVNAYSAEEIVFLQGKLWEEVREWLRQGARKKPTSSSKYRGASLLQQTGKWHAQINIEKDQIHLGFYFTEEGAARAYDRAAIIKALNDNARKVSLNFPIKNYEEDLPILCHIPLRKMSEDVPNDKKKDLWEMLDNGFHGRMEAGFKPLSPEHVKRIDLLKQNAVVFQPKTVALSCEQASIEGSPAGPKSPLKRSQSPFVSAVGPVPVVVTPSKPIRGLQQSRAATSPPMSPSPCKKPIPRRTAARHLKFSDGERDTVKDPKKALYDDPETEVTASKAKRVLETPDTPDTSKRGRRPVSEPDAPSPPSSESPSEAPSPPKYEATLRHARRMRRKSLMPCRAPVS